jgi:hypothetical protein
VRNLSLQVNCLYFNLLYLVVRLFQPPKVELILDGFYKLLYRSKQQKEILWAFRKAFRLGATGPGCWEKVEREIPQGSVFYWLSMFNSKLGKRETMDIVKAVHDLALVTVLYAIVMAPRAIDTYLARRK